jgi:hypothetical protein
MNRSIMSQFLRDSGRRYSLFAASRPGRFHSPQCQIHTAAIGQNRESPDRNAVGAVECQLRMQGAPTTGARASTPVTKGVSASQALPLLMLTVAASLALRSNGGLLYDVLDPAVAGGDDEGSD